MKIGDLVRLRDSQARTVGILIADGIFAAGWWTILDFYGEEIVWPETQLEVISETK